MRENGFDKSREIRAFMFSHHADEYHAAVATANSSLRSCRGKHLIGFWRPGYLNPRALGVVLHGLPEKTYHCHVSPLSDSSGIMALWEGSWFIVGKEVIIAYDSSRIQQERSSTHDIFYGLCEQIIHSPYHQKLLMRFGNIHNPSRHWQHAFHGWTSQHHSYFHTLSETWSRL